MARQPPAAPGRLPSTPQGRPDPQDAISFTLDVVDRLLNIAGG
jgi:hypothetical protein